MKVIETYYKNSNTGELIKSTRYAETKIKGISTYFYGIDGQGIGENLKIVGFVEISKKKWNTQKRKQHKPSPFEDTLGDYK